MIETILAKQSGELCKKLILDDKVSIDKLNELFGQEHLQQTVEQIIIEKPDALNDRLLNCIAEENKFEVITLARLSY